MLWNKNDDDEGADTSGFAFVKTERNRKALEALTTLHQKSVNFPLIAAWLDKKNHAFPFNWHQRWVIVKESFILWTDFEAECGDPKVKKERNKFKHISLLQVDSVEPVNSGKDKRKFKVVVSTGNKTKEYLWRCENEAKRNRWTMELQYRMEHAKSMVDFLSADVIDLY